MANSYDIYPLTICNDRYGGTYSGGEWTAWNCGPGMVPSEIFEDDIACWEFWCRATDSEFNEGIPPFGVGNTVKDAINDLARKVGTK